MTKLQKEKREQIRKAYYEVMRLCDKGFHSSGDLQSSLELSIKIERNHRKLGRHLNQNLRGRAPVQTCAMLFVIKGFFTPKKARSYQARLDYVKAYAAAHGVERNHAPEYRALRRKLKAAIEIDYTALI